MNFYNPYLYALPQAAFTNNRVGLLSRLFGSSNITFGSILNGTQKALNFANQAIPLVKQVRPILGNAKTMFKVMNEFKKVEVKDEKHNYKSNNNEDISLDNNIESDNGPTFFM